MKLSNREFGREYDTMKNATKMGMQSFLDNLNANILNDDAKVTLTIKQLNECVCKFSHLHDEDQICNESRSAVLASLLASLFAVGSIVRADDIQKNIPPKASQEQIQAALDKASGKTYGGFSAAQATNIVMCTLYYEGRGETLKARKMIATVLWNRAGGDINNLPGVCLRKSQFSEWNDLTSTERTPVGFTIAAPSSINDNKLEMNVWNECRDIVETMFDETFEPLGNYNMFLNLKTADKSAVNGWAKKMTNQITVGKHTFGYLPEHDGFKKAHKAQLKIAKSASQPSGQTTIYEVKKTDNGISYIARDLINAGKYKNTTTSKLTNEILKLNSFKKDKRGNPIIKPGQKIKIPAFQ